MKRQLVVLARWPVPGRCKRRLAAGIGHRQAARVQERLNGHTLASAQGLEPWRDALIRPELVLAAEPLGQRAAGRWAALLGAARGVRQGGGNLGVRMQRQVQRAWREGARQVVLIGSDLPGLQPGDLGQAFQALEQTPLVLGPASDGGYWLIGLGHQAPARLAGRLFSGMPWGSAQVLACTLAAARREGVEPVLLAERADLDRAADLRPWR